MNEIYTQVGNTLSYKATLYRYSELHVSGTYEGN